ncbi:hypothetical protein ACJMK2_031493 [Sinanodonta woodiana]|uniref:FAS1 domain-containing protein n=1 Tax=Sinanodonta woodiana TaxID=1069815 RepID=A0ABD3WYZ4_SINWO
MRALSLSSALCLLGWVHCLPNLMDLIASSNASTLLDLINKAGLADVLRDQGPFTVLVPTNAAFAKIPQSDLDVVESDPGKLADMIQYHIVKGDVFSWDLATSEHLQSLNGHVIRVYTTGNKHYFNQAAAVKEELQASNGVLYMIDEVLNVPEGMIAQVLANPDYNTSEFLSLLVKAHLASYFNHTSPTSERNTVFVPSNDAFNSLPDDMKRTIANNINYLRMLIDYHVHPGTLHASSITKDGTLSTRYPGHFIGIKMDSSGNAKLNNIADLLQTDIEADNGVIHVISHVLIPSSLAPIVG